MKPFPKKTLKKLTFTRAVFKSGDSYCITIPMEIIKALNIKEKEQLKIWLDDHHHIIIEELENPPEKEKK